MKFGMIQIIAIVLVVGGILGLAFGSFSFTKDEQKAKLGPLELSVAEKETVNVPVWASVAAILVGGGLLAAGYRRT